MADVPRLIPAGVRRYLQTVERQQARAQEKRTDRIVKLLAAGKGDEAIALMVGDRCPVSERVQKFVDAIPEPDKTTDRSPSAIKARQRKLVHILTSGQRCSLNRAWKIAGYGNHHQSLDQLLSSPTVVDLFKRAVEQGRSLPAKYADRITAAIENRDLGLSAPGKAIVMGMKERGGRVAAQSGIIDHR